ncbi:MAG: glucose 1-dehydrogenase [Sphingomonas sp.]|uniref:SDR family NAD(P)-dependent oxidoreductase n=1 Tax=Sphingomonas sp. TaxID=28214 RepID=UPI0025F84304|nr:glucose 1-dehydrogenase [Sphingomonas sp.]MBX3564171.1 glucose 1-dehydrogenase [Sphingomonas sp.]
MALITGAARGIGRAIAQDLADAGAVSILTDIQAQECADAAAAIMRTGARAHAFGLDVSDHDACHALAERVRTEVGAVSILVNSAGILLQGRIDAEGALATWRRTLAINIDGPFNLCHAFHAQLKETRGTVINLASIRSFVAPANAAAYATSKGAVMQLTKALAVEWAEEGIRVNAIAPGFVETTLLAAGEKTPEREAAILARTPMKRQGRPEDIGGLTVYLASDSARFVTGAVIPVDGGYLAG